MKKTRKSFWTGPVAILLCFAMLIGTTFAWFTDSVTSANNKIESGNLAVDLELLDKDSNTWNSVKDSEDSLFNYDLWEPGYTEVKMLKVENEGTLALKWYAKFVSESELSELAKVIDVYVTSLGVLDDASSVTYPADRQLDGYTKVGTLEYFVNNIQSTLEGNLKAGEAEYFGIALKMQETAGNEYQGLDLAGNFDISIMASQYTYEEDSYDETYDKGAYNEKVFNADQLASALAQGNKVILGADIELDSVLTIKEGETVVIDLAGQTLSLKSGGKVIDNYGTLTIEDSGKDGSVAATEAYAIRNYNNLTVNDGIIDGGIYNSGQLVVNDGTVQTLRGGYSHAIYSNGGSIEINGGTFTGNGNEVINANSDVAIINGGYFEKVEKTSYLLAGKNMILLNGTFMAHASNPAGHPVRPDVTIYGGTFNYEPNAAEGYNVVNNNDGTWTVISYIVSNGEELAAILKDTSLTGDVAIIVTNDISVPASVKSISAGANYILNTIDPDGITINFEYTSWFFNNANITVGENVTLSSRLFSNNGTATLTVNGKVSVCESSNSIFYNHGTLIVNEGGELDVIGYTNQGGNAKIYGTLNCKDFSVYSAGSILVSGANALVNVECSDYESCYISSSSTKINIENGATFNVTGSVGLVTKSSSAVITIDNATLSTTKLTADISTNKKAVINVQNNGVLNVYGDAVLEVVSGTKTGTIEVNQYPGATVNITGTITGEVNIIE